MQNVFQTFKHSLLLKERRGKVGRYVLRAEYVTKAVSQLSARALADLAKSGIDAKLALKLGIEPVAAAFGKASDNYRLPYYELDGKINGFYRDKLFDNPKQKYSQERGKAPRVYHPPNGRLDTIAKDATKPLLIVEGEKKAACGCKFGFDTIGMGGVRNWKSKGKPIPDLDRIAWTEREVQIAFDSDKYDKPDVLRAQEALAATVSDGTVLAALLQGRDVTSCRRFLLFSCCYQVKTGQRAAQCSQRPPGVHA